MSATQYPCQMAGGVPVITAPAEIDITTAGELRAVLLGWQGQGHTTVVVNMTGTEFCDSAGLRELVWAHKRAAAHGGWLRLAIRDQGAVARLFTVTGLDGILPRFATVEQALAWAPAVPARAPRAGPAPEPTAAPASMREDGKLAAESRNCEQCGATFVPQREHARFCSPGCRAAWNGAHLGDPAVDASALSWSIAAMSEATARLPAVKPESQQQALAAIGEAVWWITMVDATLMRHHQAAYGTVLAAHSPAKRRLIVETLAGLRYVRGWISRGAALDEAIETGERTWHITGWTWKPAGEPALAWLPPRAQAWERARHRAYQARLSGHTIGVTIGQVVTFLTLTGAEAAAIADASGRQPSAQRRPPGQSARAAPPACEQSPGHGPGQARSC